MKKSYLNGALRMLITARTWTNDLEWTAGFLIFFSAASFLAAVAGAVDWHLTVAKAETGAEEEVRLRAAAFVSADCIFYNQEVLEDKYLTI